MAFDNNIKHFTAADIEKYHKGLLSNKERHELEKAALDDPFLSDAMEGYATVGVQVETDLEELKKRLSQKTEETKIILLKKSSNNNFRLLRAAVLLAFVAGAGLLIYQFGFNKKAGEIAQAETKNKEEVKLLDSIKTTTTTAGKVTAPVSETEPSSDLKAGPTTKKDVITKSDIKTGSGAGLNKEIRDESVANTDKTKTEDVLVNKPVETLPKAPPAAPVISADDKPIGYKADPVLAEKKEAAKRESTNKLKGNKQEIDKDGVNDKFSGQQNNRNDAPGRQAEEQKLRSQNQSTNLFRGRVTDASNNGVPFANVTNTKDNRAGTYTDANGYFNLAYPDSVLTVEVRSVGFENNNVQLRNSVTTNQVVLQDDRKNLSEVVVTNQKPAPVTRAFDLFNDSGEPIPVDGWDKYQNYLTNNLKIPAEFKNKQIGDNQVVVSFEVDKKGTPINIKVEKSLCIQCDKEAIRLIKAGPKWNRKDKKNRATIPISF